MAGQSVSKRSVTVTAALALVAIAIALVALVVALQHETNTKIAVSSIPPTSRPVTSTTVDPCAAFNAQYTMLDTTRVNLEQLEQRFNDQLNAALHSKAPDTGTIDAKHQAVLRQISEVQERILRMEQGRPSSQACRQDPKTTTSIADQAS
jgi:hypothetical protein